MFTAFLAHPDFAVRHVASGLRGLLQRLCSQLERPMSGSLVLYMGVCYFLVLVFGPIARAQDLPLYRVDISWPKQLPNDWILGHVTGVAVDKDNHIWVLHSPNWVLDDDAGAAQDPPISECCRPAPAVLEFNADGDLLRSWGGPGYLPDWPNNEHGLVVDKENNVWIAGNWTGGVAQRRRHRPGNPKESLPWDRQVFKFTPDGKLLLEIGHPSKVSANNQDTDMLGGPWELAVDDDAHEVYIADGALNRRLVVYDSNTGAFKRGWGAYGIPLSEIDNSSKPSEYDPASPLAKQFKGPVTAVRISVDGLVYVADRVSDRVQVFTKQGKFVREFLVAPQTRGRGSVWKLALSNDLKQKYLLVADGENCVMWILNRSDGSVAGKFGHKGDSPGQFHNIYDIALDSNGNLYTGESDYNYRIQKFVSERSRWRPEQRPSQHTEN